MTAASMKMAVFWDVVPCSLVEVHWRFRSACCFHHQDFYQTTRRNILEDSHFHTRRREYLKFHILFHIESTRMGFVRVWHCSIETVLLNNKQKTEVARLEGFRVR
jgi:hypothetical protein